MSDDLIAWCRAQLDEDERVAVAALHPDAVRPGSWSADPYADDPERRHISEDKAGHYWSVAHKVFVPIAEHIARHDPARVLREVAAKRAIVEMHGGRHECTSAEDSCGWWVDPCPTLRLLASAYSDRPGYREEWRP